MKEEIIDLSGEWISSFIQNNKIYNENVNFIQNDNKITANIVLNFDGEICNYKFEGIRVNNVINGTYFYTEDSNVESGTISLKIINKDFLYGVTTYISTDINSDDVIQSPYALFRNTKNNLGTFNLCTNCVGNSSTCCCDTDVDSPMLLPNEVAAICKELNINKEEFVKLVKFSEIHNDYSLKDLYQMKRTKETNSCIFFKNNQCTIYDIRPIDCRIFPYDIKLEQDGNYYLVYYKSDKCQIMNEDIKNIKMVSYNTRLFLRLLLPYIREWSDKYCSTSLTKKRNYEIICKIEDLF
ncbi:MAG: YkgJ family cysteine cluster protein [Clostridia bacterium]|nr:YkgJ family cysteine cluster protein [Clostridia bacterium]